MIRGRRLVLLLAALALVSALIGYRYLTEHGFSARARPSRLETFIARRLRGLATPREAPLLVNPLRSTPIAIAEARDHFGDHCAICHGNTGDGNTMINKGLYPPAPDLREKATQRLTDGELIYIIKNGIRFSGMPGWGGDGDDEENWKLVLFIRHLPELSPEEVELIRQMNSGKSAHAHQHEKVNEHR